MNTIGFANIYYTLWEVGEPYEDKRYYDGMCVGSTIKQHVVYVQNLSQDLDKAKEKLAGSEYKIDLELRGHSTFTRILSSNIKDREEYYPHDCFSFGMMEGHPFATSTDLWQLNRAMLSEQSDTRRANAKKRLVELGELVEYKGQWIKPSRIPEMEKEEYVKSLDKGHQFTNGQKVEIEIKPLESYDFSGKYGRTYVEVYATKCGKLVKYMGKSPLSFTKTEDGDIKYVPHTDWLKVQATIKHSTRMSNLTGEPILETNLIRIKVLNQ